MSQNPQQQNPLPTHPQYPTNSQHAASHVQYYQSQQNAPQMQYYATTDYEAAYQQQMSPQNQQQISQMQPQQQQISPMHQQNINYQQHHYYSQGAVSQQNALVMPQLSSTHNMQQMVPQISPQQQQLSSMQQQQLPSPTHMNQQQLGSPQKTARNAPPRLYALKSSNSSLKKPTKDGNTPMTPVGAQSTGGVVPAAATTTQPVTLTSPPTPSNVANAPVQSPAARPGVATLPGSKPKLPSLSSLMQKSRLVASMNQQQLRANTGETAGKVRVSTLAESLQNATSRKQQQQQKVAAPAPAPAPPTVTQPASISTSTTSTTPSTTTTSVTTPPPTTTTSTPSTQSIQLASGSVAAAAAHHAQSLRMKKSALLAKMQQHHQTHATMGTPVPNTAVANSPTPAAPIHSVNKRTKPVKEKSVAKIKVPPEQDAMEVDEDNITPTSRRAATQPQAPQSPASSMEDENSDREDDEDDDLLRHWARIPSSHSSVMRFLYKKDPRPIIQKQLTLVSSKMQYFHIAQQHPAHTYVVQIAEKHPFLTIKCSTALQPNKHAAYYYEITCLNTNTATDADPNFKPHCRLGFMTSEADDRVPVGYCENGVSYRDVDGSAVHKSKRHTYGESFHSGDVIGCLIYLPESDADHERPMTQVDLGDSKDRLVEQNGETYEFIMEVLKKDTLGAESCVVFFKNGVCQGVARSDLLRALWYPAVSLYMGAKVDINFGHKSFKHFPESGVECLANPNVTIMPVVDVSRNFHYHPTFVPASLDKRVEKYKSKLEQNILPAKRKASLQSGELGSPQGNAQQAATYAMPLKKQRLS